MFDLLPDPAAAFGVENLFAAEEGREYATLEGVPDEGTHLRELAQHVLPLDLMLDIRVENDEVCLAANLQSALVLFDSEKLCRLLDTMVNYSCDEKILVVFPMLFWVIEHEIILVEDGPENRESEPNARNPIKSSEKVSLDLIFVLR